MIKITSVDEAIGANGLKMLVHSQAGAGKTMLSATTGVPTLIISAEAGLLSIQGAPDYIKTTVVESIDDMNNVHRYLSTQPHPYEWVQIDSISEIAEVCLSKELGKNPDPRKSYPAFQDEMGKVIRKFRDLRGINVMMTCKQVRKEDQDSGITRYSPMMPGNKLGAAIPYWFDLVLALRVERDDDKKVVRFLQTFQDLKFEAKDRSGVLEPYEPPNLQKILAKVKAKLDKTKSEPVIADKELYFYDKEESEVIVIKKGDEYQPTIRDYTTEMTSKEYSEYCEVDHDDIPGEFGKADEVKILTEPESDEVKGELVSHDDTYWYHAESECVVIIKAGDEIDDETASQCSEMSKEEYDNWIELQEEMKAEKEFEKKTKKIPEDEVIDVAMKKTYYYHAESNHAFIINKGESLPSESDREEILEVITKAKYDKWVISTANHENEKEPELAKKVMYYYHNTNESVLKVKKGEPIPKDDGNLEEISAAQYLKSVNK